MMDREGQACFCAQIVTRACLGLFIMLRSARNHTREEVHPRTLHRRHWGHQFCLLYARPAARHRPVPAKPGPIAAAHPTRRARPFRRHQRPGAADSAHAGRPLVRRGGRLDRVHARPGAARYRALPRPDRASTSSSVRLPSIANRPRDCRSPSRCHWATLSGSIRGISSRARSFSATAYRNEGFPAVIVRPSHTYDRTKLPCSGGYTSVARMRAGKPIVVHGDGTSTWVLTHHADFAKGFVGLLGNSRTLGEAFHITSDELLSWNQIYGMIGKAAGAEPKIIHAPADLIVQHHKDWGDGLLGDKSHSVLFDNSKIKRFVPDFACTIPFSRGVEEVMAWFDADPARQVIDPGFDRAMDEIVEAMGRAMGAS